MTKKTKKQNRSREVYLRNLRTVTGVIALIIGVGTFLIWYLVALDTYPNVPIYAERFHYYGCYLALSLTFLGLTAKTKKLEKQLIYYAGSNFYMLLTLTFLLDQYFDVLLKQNKVIFTLILTIISCIIYYLIRRLRS